jgi:hypothetical protein
VVAEEDAEDGKDEAEEKTPKIYILFHSRIRASAAGHVSGGAPSLPSRPRNSSYKMTAPFVTPILSDLWGASARVVSGALAANIFASRFLHFGDLTRIANEPGL